MHNNKPFKTLGLLLAFCCAISQAQASSIASSAADAGSSASDSASSTLETSSKGSSDDDKVAAGNYRITNIATAPEKTNRVRITLQAENNERSLTLDLPTATWTAQHLALGDVIHAQTHNYGLEFARIDTQEAFFLVLNDDWHSELESRPLGKL
jgi:hypothetical protein